MDIIRRELGQNKVTLKIPEGNGACFPNPPLGFVALDSSQPVKQQHKPQSQINASKGLTKHCQFHDIPLQFIEGLDRSFVETLIALYVLEKQGGHESKLSHAVEQEKKAWTLELQDSSHIKSLFNLSRYSSAVKKDVNMQDDMSLMKDNVFMSYMSHKFQLPVVAFCVEESAMYRGHLGRTFDLSSGNQDVFLIVHSNVEKKSKFAIGKAFDILQKFRAVIVKGIARSLPDMKVVELRDLASRLLLPICDPAGNKLAKTDLLAQIRKN